MPEKVVKRRVSGGVVLYLGRPNLLWQPHRVHEIRQIYRAASDLRDFASQLQLAPKQARKLLELAGIDYLWRLHKSYLLGETCSKVAQRNGMKLRTLTRLFKEAGISILRGPRQPRLPTKKLKRIWKTCDNIINRFAVALDVRWATAKKIHESIYLAPWERPSRTLYDDT